MKKRKKSIFEYILVPLLAVIIVQGLFSLVTFQYAGTTKMLHENSVEILKQTSENRKNQLENLMISNWSNVAYQMQGIEIILREFLEKNNLTIDEFTGNKEYQRAFLIQVSPTVIDGIRSNNVTGSFLILSNELEEAKAKEREGIYFRDSDPDKNPNDYTDLSMVKGRAEIGKEFQIPLEPLWEGKFHFWDLEEEQTAYYLKPLSIAQKNPNEKYTDLGYWSEPFYLNENSGMDSYEQITYSIPLVYNGTVYGVYGNEIEMGYFLDKLPVKEIDSERLGSYVLVDYTKKNEVNILAESGSLLELSGLMHNKVKLTNTNYEKLLNIVGTDLYGILSPLKLYNQNSPFGDKQFAVLTVASEEKLFGIGNDLLKRFVIVTLISLLFGVICIYFVAGKATKPIRVMAEYLRKSKRDELRHFQSVGAKEIDELYEVICNLNDKQLETEVKLKVEKERYIAALESSTNIIFEYSLEEDIFCQYNFTKNEEGAGYIDKKEMRNAREILKNFKLLDKEDQKRLDEFFLGMTESNMMCICLSEKSDEDKCYEVRGKLIKNEYGVPQKIVGSIRDVSEELQKKKELELIKDRDSITGLLNLQAGKRKLLGWECEGRTYRVLLIDIDHFNRINENYGIVFGNMVLEELGNSVCNKVQDGDISIRCGGDQILVALWDRTVEEAYEFCVSLNKDLEELHVRANIDVSISIGMVCYQVGEIEFREMINRACFSMEHAKGMVMTHHDEEFKETEIKVAVYEEITQECKQIYEKHPKRLREIMGINYEKTMSLSSVAFNVFEKAQDVTTVIPFLLGKVAKAFGCSDVVVSMVDYDFCTNRIYYQWHSKIENIPKINICKYTEINFKAAIANITNEKFLFQKQSDESVFDQYREFYFLKDTDGGVCFPMFEGHTFVGLIAFSKMEESSRWDEKEYEKLQGIVNIIRTNISKNKLDIASKAKSEFLSRMSHEIRTPMNAILGMCNIALQQSEVPARVYDCLKKIYTSSNYLLKLINDILDMSKIESGKLTLEHRPFQTEELINSVEELIRPQTEQKNITFQVSQALPDTKLIGDMLRLNQVLINLLGNALKFTPEGGKIILSVEKMWEDETQAGIRFGVKDNGIGISQEEKERVFRAFEQAKESTSRAYGGTGLGLSICKNLVQMMGGELKLVSELGKGCDFSFILTFQKSLQSISEKENKELFSVDQFDFSGKKVLLVEDIELNVEIAKTILELGNFEVEVACDGKVATEMFEASKPGYYDVILMDVRMPVMDGLEATRRIRKMEKEDAMTIPIIAMTANAFDEDMKKSIESGMNGHLTKPIDMDKFYKMLSEIVGEESSV